LHINEKEGRERGKREEGRETREWGKVEGGERRGERE
jgi:hypothetical protein